MDRLAIIEKRRNLLNWERELLTLPQLEIEIRHHFAPGVYAREALIPAGSLVTGKIHKSAHLNIIAYGRILIYNAEDNTSVEIIGPYTFTSQAGTKRVGIALEDTSWMTVHVTNETDIDKIEAEVIAKTFEDVPQPSLPQEVEV